jgi:hypothetical protein
VFKDVLPNWNRYFRKVKLGTQKNHRKKVTLVSEILNLLPHEHIAKNGRFH